MYRATNGPVQVVESGRNEAAKVHDGRRAWRLLRSNPDYVADWRANGGPVVQEALPFPLRRQTVLLRATDRETAVAHYQAFKWDVIGKLPHEDFSLRLAKVRDWLASRVDR